MLWCVFVQTFLLLVGKVAGNYVTIATQFDASSSKETELALLSLRSFRVFGGSAQFNEANVCVWNCAALTVETSSMLQDLSIIIHKMEVQGVDVDIIDRNILCSIYVSNYYFKSYRADILNFFASHTFIYSNDITKTTLVEKFSSDFVCQAKVDAAAIESSSGNVCSLDFFLQRSSAGMGLFRFFNATVNANMSASSLLSAAISNSVQNWRFISGYDGDFPVVYAAKHWSHAVDSVQPVLLEFDGTEHSLDTQDCVIKIGVKWPFYNTVNVITSSLHILFDNSTLAGILAGCLHPGSLTHSVHSDGVQLPSVAPPMVPEIEHHEQVKIYDCVLFFDEISMLLLRLESLHGLVDEHIIIESTITFSGKSKPLYFRENMHLFSKYIDKITYIQLNGLLHNQPNGQNEVFANEYFSRNSISEALSEVGARDRDVFIIADTDEIPHPVALENLRAVFNREVDGIIDTTKIFKLFVDYYLYNFECFVGFKYLKSQAITATSIGVAKQLAKAFPNVDPDRQYLEIARQHMHYEATIPLHNVMYPGGWHLSFFESAERIKRKLLSYGHQNFIDQFVPDNNVTDENVAPGGRDMVEVGESMSVDAIAARVKEGKQVDYRKTDSCRPRPSRRKHIKGLSPDTDLLEDGYTDYMIRLWHEFSSVHDQI